MLKNSVIISTIRKIQSDTSWNSYLRPGFVMLDSETHRSIIRKRSRSVRRDTSK